jgi:hypothetical protein
MRAALRAIAEGDVAPFADIINEAVILAMKQIRHGFITNVMSFSNTVMVSYYANHAKEWVKGNSGIYPHPGR